MDQVIKSEIIISLILVILYLSVTFMLRFVARYDWSRSFSYGFFICLGIVCLGSISGYAYFYHKNITTNSATDLYK